MFSATKLLLKQDLKVYGTTASLWMSLNSFMTWTNKGTANMLLSTHIQCDAAVVAVCVVFTLVYAK